MKARTVILTVGAVFALAAPAAQASLDRTLPAKTSVATHHKIAAKHHSATAKQHKVTKSTGPLYIYFPGTPNQASIAPSPDDCVMTGNNCSDQQLCDIWGMNCDLTVAPQTNDPTPVDPAPPASTQSATAASEVSTSVGDTSTTDNSDEDC